MVRLVFLVVALALVCSPAHAQSAGCSNDSDCIGSALVLSGANQYVDVPLTPSFNEPDSLGAITVEMWLNVTPAPGMVQVIAGKWGPRRDRDDEWLMLIDDKDSLHFRISNGGSSAADADNTDAAVKFSPWYNTWVHVAGVWDSTTHAARLFVNGVIVDSAVNGLYPARSMRRTSAYLQLGSFNGFSNAAANYRTLSGQIDELRIWSTVRPADSLACGRYHRFSGNEPRLVAYYPCDGGADPSVLCDLSANGNDGSMRNGAQTLRSTRTVPQFVVTNVTDTIRLTLFCATDTTFSFTLTDTSLCGSRVAIGVAGTNALTLTPAPATLPSRIAQTINGSLRFTGIGIVDARIIVQPLGSCSPPLVLPVRITRATPLTLSLGRIAFDTLHGCQSTLFLDTVVQFCNTSTGPITITGLTKNLIEFDTILAGWQTPITLAPGECHTFTVRFRGTHDSTYRDTLRILSADTCSGSGSVALVGTVRQYLRTVDSLDFGNVYMCADSASVGKVISLISGAPAPVTVQQVQASTPRFGTSNPLPFQVPAGQKRDLFIQLKYNAPGVFQDSVVITSLEGGCSIVHTVYVRANVIAINFVLTPAILNFGNRFVGTSATLQAILRNAGITRRGAFVFLKSGKAFKITGPNAFLLNAGDSAAINVTFSPTDTIIYNDTLIVQDTTCYKTWRLPLTGRGIAGPFTIYPAQIDYGAVANCLCGSDTITVTNTKAVPLLMRAVSIGGPGFAVVPPPGVNETIAPGEVRRYVITFCPAPLTDGAYAGSVTFTSDDAITPVLVVPLVGVRVSTRFSTPPFTDYGTVEINQTRDLTINVQNGSPFGVCIDSITVPPGFQLISTTPPMPDTLGLTRILQIRVRFAPTAQQAYSGQVKIYTSCPCAEIETTSVRGVGAVIGVSFPWSTIVFTQVTLCDSVSRRIVIENPSHQNVSIDSIYLTGPSAAAFSWRGVNFASVTPSALDSLSNDTLELTFHPKLSPFIFTNATLVVVATNAAAVQRFSVALTGSRRSQFVISDDSIDFGAVAVRYPAATQTITLWNFTPADTIVIDSMWIVPDAGVFTWTAPPLNGSAVRLRPGDSINVAIDFKPLAAVAYTARLGVRVARPCPEIDASIRLYGSGFTPVVLINACFDSAAASQIGEEFSVGVVLARLVPQTPVGVDLIVNYDVHAVRLESVLAPVCGSNTIWYTPTGAVVSLKSCVNVDSGQICRMIFRALVPDSVVASIAIDSVAFLSDTSQVKALLGQGCGTTATIAGRCNITHLVVNPNATVLEQSVPNPASERVRITFNTVEDTRVCVRIFDMLGREVLRPIDTFQRHGRYLLDIDLRSLPPGTYSYMLDAGVYHASKIMEVTR